MPLEKPLPRDFFARHTVDVARDLLGKRLVRRLGDQWLSGIILETEAYRGEEDLGCHARAGLTPRTRVMYGPPGHAYVYFTYGMHWMLNIVTEPAGFPAAVLIRAILPVEGLEVIGLRRAPQPPHRWTDGPAKLCRAFAINGAQNGIDLCNARAEIFVTDGVAVREASIVAGPRVGLINVPEPWKSVPWRFRVSVGAVSEWQK